MAQFTASAYVWIDDKKKREEIFKRLGEIGYEKYPYKDIFDADNIVCFETYDDGYYNGLDWIHTSYIPNYWAENIKTIQISYGEDYGFDCGTDINLFLELAQMRSDTDEGQWFIEDKIRFDGIGGQIIGCEPIRKIGERWFKYDGDDNRVTYHIREYKDNGGRCFVCRATPQEVYEHLKNIK